MSSSRKGGSAAGPSGMQAVTSEKAVLARWQALRQEVSALFSRIAELEMELSEHRLVASAIAKLDPARRCFRMVGGVLVERTVGEVLPAVQRNLQGLEELVGQLAASLAGKRAELEGLEKKYNIRIRSMDEAVGGAGQEKEKPEGGKKGASTGVLVGS